MAREEAEVVVEVVVVVVVVQRSGATGADVVLDDDRDGAFW